MKRFISLLFIMVFSISAFCAFAEEPMALKRGLHFEMTFDEAAKMAGKHDDSYCHAGLPCFDFEDTVAGRKDVTITVHADESNGLHSIQYEFDTWYDAEDIDTQAYRETERSLQDKYGVPVYSDGTARMLPFPSEEIDSMGTSGYHVYTMTSLIGEKYNDKRTARHDWDCPKYSQWVIQDGDHYIVIEHSLVEWKYYKKASSSSLSTKYDYDSSTYTECIHYSHLTADEYQRYIVDATNAASDDL